MVTAPDRAPGSLELVRLFENTLSLPDGPDELDTVEHAAAWCRRHGLPAVAGNAELHRLRDFREALRDVLFANNGEGRSRDAWEGLRSFVAPARLMLAIESEGRLALRPSDPDCDGAIASLLARVHDALLEGTWPRLRACRKATCRYAYYDRTKNASRAWCSMATCGNQAKAQRRRHRERPH